MPLCLMTKKESEKEVERPHYYSQFWLDVAAGRRVIGTPKSEDGAEEAEPELAEATVGRKPVRDSLAAVSDGHQETFAPTDVEPLLDEEEYAAEPELEEELVGAVDELGNPDIVVDEPELAEVPTMAQEEEEPEPEEEPIEPFFEDEEEEEEDWTIGRGRKKAKPRAQKQPPKRQEKRRRY